VLAPAASQQHVGRERCISVCSSDLLYSNQTVVCTLVHELNVSNMR
jgi:hypothetical protein